MITEVTGPSRQRREPPCPIKFDEPVSPEQRSGVHAVSDRDLVDAYAMNLAYEIHADDLGFGYRFIAAGLADAGHELSERRV